jgi:hypothetical protein
VSSNGYFSHYLSPMEKKYFLLFSSESTRIFYIRPAWHAKAKLNFLWPEQEESIVRVKTEPDSKAFCMIGSYTSCSFSGVTSCKKSELSQQTKQEVQVGKSQCPIIQEIMPNSSKCSSFFDKGTQLGWLWFEMTTHNLLLFGSISMVCLCTQIILAILFYLYVHVTVVSHHPAGHFRDH